MRDNFSVFISFYSSDIHAYDLLKIYCKKAAAYWDVANLWPLRRYSRLKLKREIDAHIQLHETQQRAGNKQSFIPQSHTLSAAGAGAHTRGSQTIIKCSLWSSDKLFKTQFKSTRHRRRTERSQLHPLQRASAFSQTIDPYKWYLFLLILIAHNWMPECVYMWLMAYMPRVLLLRESDYLAR